MAIKTLDNVFIDGANRLFGGFIYAIDYQQSFGEQPSLLKVTITNENGVFNISQNDLRLDGPPSLVKIGTKIQLYCYPIQYEIEDSPQGRVLQIEYVDESIIYLDKKVVKLKKRGISGEVYPNTIVVGIERNLVQVVGGGVAAQALIINSSATITNIKVPEIQYTFLDLLVKLRDFTGIVPPTTSQLSGYYQSYSGTLREVISAWCNDLGFGFYWENRKLNFIDLRNPANLAAVKSYADSITSANKTASINTSYSLRDTVSRGIYSFYGKNGEIVEDNLPQDKAQYTFNCLTAENIPFTTNFNDDNFPLKPSKVSAAYYGADIFLVANLINSQSFGGAATNGYNVDDYYQIYPVNKADPILPIVVAGTKYASGYNTYNWFKVQAKNGSQFNIVLARYAALANFWGRFYYYKTTSDIADQLDFGNNTHNWYAEKTKLTDVAEINDIILPLSPIISNYDKLSLRGFIEKLPGDFYTDVSASDAASTNGYLIIQKAPVWNPDHSDNLYAIGNTVIIEGPSSKPAFFDGTYSVFFVGVNGNMPNFSSIQRPSTAVMQISGKYSDSSLTVTDYFPKLEFEKYLAPETKNVNRYDINFVTLSEDQIASVGSSAINPLIASINSQLAARPAQQNNANFTIWSNQFNASNTTLTDVYRNALNYNNFSTAFNIFGAALTFNQPGPFFNISFTVPNIDLATSNISVKNGLNSLSISIGDNGVKTTYSIGTVAMKVRSPGVFFRYIYDTDLRKYRTTQLSNVLLSA